MAEEDVPQAVVPELPDGEGALIIAQMAVSLADTHLEFVGIWPGDEHVHVIIRLHNHGIGFRSELQRLIGHSAYIRHYHELMVVGNDIVAHSLRRIMRDNEIPHLEAADFIPLVLDKVLTALAQERGTERMCRHAEWRVAVA